MYKGRSSNGMANKRENNKRFKTKNYNRNKVSSRCRVQKTLERSPFVKQC